MVFKRRDQPPLSDRVREAVLPRRGWRRGLEYIAHRIRRLPDTPHRIALGFACGVMMSFTPFFGIHLLGSIGLAWLIGGNVLAAAIGQVVGNPLTLPLIAWISMWLGRRLLGGGLTGRSFERVDQALAGAAEGLWQTFLSLFGLGESQWERVSVVWSDIVLPYFVGGLLPGLITSAVFYYLVRFVVSAYQARRRARRLAGKTAADAAAGDAYKPGEAKDGAKE